MRSIFLAATLLFLSTGYALASDSASTVKLDGLLDFRKPGDFMICDGQRVKATPSTKITGAKDAKSIPVGYVMKVKGTRDAQGTVIATEIETKANTVDGTEAKLIAGADMAESTWVAAGAIVDQDANGKQTSMGALHKTGPEVDRVRGILDRVLPPHIQRSQIRVYVVDNKEWNAMAMPNYSVYVFTGILQDLNDNEMALVLGHELTHAIYEHGRRQASKSTISSIAGQAAMIGASKIGSGIGRTVAQQAASLGYSAFNNTYSRGYEDQADRVGMRYAYEAGYDETVGPGLWHKFAAKYADLPKIQNYFYGNHSTSDDRAKNLQAQIAMNYTGTIDPPTHPKGSATKTATAKSTTSKTAKAPATTTSKTSTTTKSTVK
jgi:Zn-dependent protease with chaperone function